MNEVKIPEERLIELVNHENVLADLLKHLYDNRSVVIAYADTKVVEKSPRYNVSHAYLEDVLINNMKGFKEEIEDEKDEISKSACTNS